MKLCIIYEDNNVECETLVGLLITGFMNDAGRTVFGMAKKYCLKDFVSL